MGFRNNCGLAFLQQFGASMILKSRRVAAWSTGTARTAKNARGTLLAHGSTTIYRTPRLDKRDDDGGDWNAKDVDEDLRQRLDTAVFAELEVDTHLIGNLTPEIDGDAFTAAIEGLDRERLQRDEARRDDSYDPLMLAHDPTAATVLDQNVRALHSISTRTLRDARRLGPRQLIVMARLTTI